MKSCLNKSQVERFSRQLVLKNIGAKGQKKILSSKILIVGVGGLGCPAAESLVRAGIGTIGLIDNDIVNLSNIHRQSLFNSNDVSKLKVSVAAKKLKEINPLTKIKIYRSRLSKNNIENVIKNYELIIDGSDNFETKFLINDYCIKLKKKLITGAISKFDGHIFTFDFKDKKTASLKSFYQENEISDDILNCEFEGVIGTTASIVGTTQANEALKMILEIGQNLKNQILIIDLLNLNFRKVKFKKRLDVIKK
jgi:adenylyltransferase/sulfurtransferase